MENWNDDRLDELSGRMDAGFKQTARSEEINRRMDDADARSHRFEVKVGEEFGRMTDRLDKLFYIQLAFLATLSAALITHTV